MSTLKQHQSTYDTLPLPGKLAAIQSEAAAARTQDEYTGARVADEGGEPVEWQVRFASPNGLWRSWHPISRDAFDRYHADPPAGVQLRQLYDAPPAAQAVPESLCQWYSEDRDELFHTSCGTRFRFNTGGPTQNGFECCPFCGLDIAAPTSEVEA